jgi:hypothetical protein
MARDGSRAFERDMSARLALANAVRLQRQKNLGLPPATQPLLPNVPKFPEIEKIKAEAMARQFTPSLDEYAIARIRLEQIEPTDNHAELPRILCSKSGAEIGVVSPSQYAIMRAIWPSMTKGTAEELIARCGMIAPQFLFTMPQAWQILAASNAAATLTFALEIGLRAEWTTSEKAERNAAWEKEGEDADELTLIAFELVSDLARICRDWFKLPCNADLVPQIINCREIGELVELLKDTCTNTAHEIFANPRGFHNMSQARVLELLERHGVVIQRKRAPIIGEANLIKRIIGMFYRDFAYLTAQLTGDELLAIIGNANRFHEKTLRAYSQGRKPVSKELQKYHDAAQRENAIAEARSLFDTVIEDEIDTLENNIPAIKTLDNRVVDRIEQVSRLKAWAEKRKQAQTE